MDDDTTASDDERTVELSTIAAIFPELILDPANPYTATLELPVTPVKPLRIHFKQAADDAPPLTQLPTPPTSAEQGEGDEKDGVKVTVQQGQNQTDTHELEHLPPLRLKITLPQRYPAEEAPAVELDVIPQWLPSSTLQRLKDDCSRLWEEFGRDQVVFSYIDHLQQRAEDAFGLTAESGQDTGEVAMSSDLKLALLDFDLKTKRERFEQETFDCGICLEPKKGKHCHRLMLCRHVFCTGCLKDFYNACITEGDVDNVKCLSPQCGVEKNEVVDEAERAKKRRKQDRTLNPSELLQIPIAQELVQRYVRLKRKKKLEADKNTIYCPRQWCQGAAKSKKHPKPSGSMDDFSTDTEDEQNATQNPAQDPAKKQKKKPPEDIPMSQRLAVCEDCDFAFCCVCRKGWHGELSICNPRRQAELNEEEQASLAYLQHYSTPCPTCNAPSQKSMGCNHMICFKCKTHFCYLCSSYLMEDNPYRHFNDMKSTCYMRLWELEAGDGAGVRHNFAGGVQDWEAEADNDEEFDEDDDEAADEVENFEAFGGDEPLFLADDSSDDEEPAPDIRRHERAIEIVNFAGNGANQRIVIPERPRVQGDPPPPAPVPPRPRRNNNNNNNNRGRGRRVNQHRRAVQNEPHHNRQRPDQQRDLDLDFFLNQVDEIARLPDDQAPPHPLQDGQNRVRAPAQQQQVAAAAAALLQPRPAPGQDRFAAQQPAPVRAMGLERFLELARQDLEDEWDSDELDEDEPVGGREPLDVMVRRVRRERGAGGR